MSNQREYAYTRRDFDRLRSISNARSGIVVTDDKYDMFYSRLARRVRALGLGSFAEYCDFVDSPDNVGELTELVNAVTTNLTSFFRENHHFTFLAEQAVPDIVQRNAGSRSLRIWSAGCSTGEEPYSIAMVLAEQAERLRGWYVRVLASDIDSNVLAQAATGVYPIARVEGIARERLKRHFQRGTGSRAGKVRLKAATRAPIEFRQINLMEPLSLETQDIIFCRNVIIYFDKPSKTALVERYADALADGGYLIIGHSESLYQITDRFKPVGNTIYRKVR